MNLSRRGFLRGAGAATAGVAVAAPAAVALAKQHNLPDLFAPSSQLAYVRYPDTGMDTWSPWESALAQISDATEGNATMEVDGNHVVFTPADTSRPSARLEWREHGTGAKVRSYDIQMARVDYGHYAGALGYPNREAGERGEGDRHTTAKMAIARKSDQAERERRIAVLEHRGQINRDGIFATDRDPSDPYEGRTLAQWRHGGPDSDLWKKST